MSFLPMKMKVGTLCAGILLTGFEMKTQGNNEPPAKVKLGLSTYEVKDAYSCVQDVFEIVTR